MRHDLTLRVPGYDIPAALEIPSGPVAGAVLLIEVVAKAGGTAAFAVGGKGVGDSTYYVRRDAKDVKDTIIASKYTIDEMVKFATEQAALP